LYLHERSQPSSFDGQAGYLAPPRPEDYEARLRFGTDTEIIRMYGGSSDDVRSTTAEAARRWVQGLLEQDYAWVIEVGTPIGQIRLDRVDLRDRRASLAVGIEDRTLLGIGLATFRRKNRIFGSTRAHSKAEKPHRNARWGGFEVVN
jgi:Acetyltransferase (GNAT) domain